jgi:hypothetical protein
MSTPNMENRLPEKTARVGDSIRPGEGDGLGGRTLGSVTESLRTGMTIAG